MKLKKFKESVMNIDIVLFIRLKRILAVTPIKMTQLLIALLYHTC